MTHIQSKIMLIGAGPGDPELLTLKAVQALKEAAVVLYDALVNPEILEHAPSQAELIYVGKRKGCYAFQQDQINELLVARAKSKGLVVRLKGGDPFIFGRGSEEMEYAQKHGIPTELIPGISSCLAVPALQNIPLTKRGVSESFWVITGTTKDHELSQDVHLAAKSNATVVILMGTAKLAEIVAIFKGQGKEELPVAIIQNGTMHKEKIGVGTVNTIQQIYTEKGLGNPAIIVLGAVVNNRREMHMLIKHTAVADG
ncbi:uroporphyrinogen-III C-methyltransferase [Flavimarina sp. Hel_I_48]|uniref:uroporphyrinogen-III C-methyltransferase n=1 Tax=Flavimarina sp. Hel_I_48 TaxID=1392488 RepID=UPI0004DEE74F|nr:uroporphyrinogen-III C-methyltransferase [Flavimarina sp. Hel_I_48]